MPKISTLEVIVGGGELDLWYADRLDAAVAMMKARRQSGVVELGHMKLTGIWEPDSADDRLKCCTRLKLTHKEPYKWAQHLITYRHLAERFQVSEPDLKYAYNKFHRSIRAFNLYRDRIDELNRIHYDYREENNR